nr:phage tail assembly chaperone [Sphingomonas cavernae]
MAGIAGALLGWRPEEFWAATPVELATVLGALGDESEAAPPGAIERAALMEMFPDG